MGADTRPAVRSALDIQRPPHNALAEPAENPAAPTRAALAHNALSRAPTGYVSENAHTARTLESQGVPRPARRFAHRAELVTNSTVCEGPPVGPHAHTPHVSPALSGAGSLRAAPLTDAERISLTRAVARAGSLRAFEAVSGVPATTVHRAANGAAVTRLVRSALLRALPATVREPPAESPPERAAGGR